jgi:hypothetical protein
MARGGVRTVTRVAFHPEAVKALEEAVFLGLYDAAREGKQRQLDIASGKFNSIRRFTRRAFAAGFDQDGERFAAEGPAPEHIDSRDKGQPVAYFGYDWFVARFYETGTARQSPRPSAAPAAAEITERLPGYLRKSAQRKGFR